MRFKYKKDNKKIVEYIDKTGIEFTLKNQNHLAPGSPGLNLK